MSMTLVSQLIKQGVTHFCLAPGFRSTPLTLAVAEHPEANVSVHFDERGLGFYALGLAKALQKPVALIVTSGTAVGNLMPAVMEAEADGVPLILLTADRPHELRETMANQTCDQIKLFGSYVRTFIELPVTNEGLPERFCATTVAMAVSSALFPLPGPVQLNCPFRKPFSSKQLDSCVEPVTYTFPKLALEDPKRWAKELSRYEKGAIVLGKGAPDASALAKQLGWPVFADILSGSRGSESIAYYHHILKSAKELKAECILHLGDAVVSKSLLSFMGQSDRLIHVAAHPKRCDPNHCVTDRVICDPADFCSAVAESVPTSMPVWRRLWEELSEKVGEVLAIPEGSEPSVLHWLSQKKTALYIGNSMPIRDADMFFFPGEVRGPIFANRGLSGIDGNIATIAGIAEVMPVTAVVGDQTALHDLNSLALLQKTRYPVQLVIINNGGGGIFSFVAAKGKQELIDPYFAAAHDKTFADAAAQFGLTYATSLDEQSQLIELFSNREENLRIHQSIDQTIAEALCFSSSTVS